MVGKPGITNTMFPCLVDEVLVVPIVCHLGSGSIAAQIQRMPDLLEVPCAASEADHRRLQANTENLWFRAYRRMHAPPSPLGRYPVVKVEAIVDLRSATVKTICELGLLRTTI